jgi:hypothetical protein
LPAGAIGEFSRPLAKFQRLLGLEQQSDENAEQVKLPPLYDLQQQIKDQSRRFNVLDVGRRAGKTYLGQHLALETTLSGYPVGWFAPNYKYLLEVWQDLTRHLRPVASRINSTERRIELENGGLVECWTLDKTDDPGRSRKYKRVIIDEAAIAPNLKNVWEQGIRATLTDLQGDAWFLSTPKGLNYFYDLFKRGQDQLAYPEWQSWQLPTSVNPFLPASEIEAARLELPELAYQQEYLAEFLSGEGAVFRNLDACLIAPETTPVEHSGHLIVGGIDWGKSHDFTALSLFCCHCVREVYLDRFNQVGWDFQRGRLLTQLERWKAKHVRIETNSIGSPNLEAMRQAAPSSITLSGFDTTKKSKNPMIERLALAFEKGVAQWLPDPVAKHELLAFEATVTETGYIRYGAPEGGFDDTVICRGLAWHAARPYIPAPMTENEKLEAQLPPGWRMENKPDVPEGSWEWDAWRMARENEIGKIKKELEEQKPNNPWKPQSPLDQMGAQWGGKWGDE